MSWITTTYLALVFIALSRGIYEVLQGVRRDRAEREISEFYFPKTTIGVALWSISAPLIPVWNAWLAARAVLIAFGFGLDAIAEILDVPLVPKRKKAKSGGGGA